MISRQRKILQIIRGSRTPLRLLADFAGLSRHPYVARTRDGLLCEIRPGCGDRYAFYEVMIRGDYLWPEARLESGDTVIDVGGNIGCFALVAAARVGPAGRVITLEPEAAAFAQLQANIRRNRLHNITPLNLALGAADGRADLHTGTVSLFSSLFDAVDGRTSGGSTQPVRVVTLRRLMDEQHIERCHLLKIDAEGAEYDILAGLSSDLARRIDQITMETHLIQGHDPSELNDRLRAGGYTLRQSRSMLFARQA